MKGTELVIKALVDNGVKYIFGYTGGAIMPIFDEMEKQKTLSFIMSRHEQGAAFMAQGISRASLSTAHPRTGVCMATSGPGAMNLVTGIADAGMDSVPLLAVTGQVEPVERHLGTRGRDVAVKHVDLGGDELRRQFHELLARCQE